MNGKLLGPALAFHAAGCSVIRASADGTKAPLGSWKRYQSKRPDEGQLRRWFANGHPGLGIVPGAVSDGLEMVEFEGRAVHEGLLTATQDLCAAAGLGDLWKRVTTGYLEMTPSDGVHMLYRVTGMPVPGNTKLAARPAREEEITDDERAAMTADTAAGRAPKRPVRVLMETRGEGGFVVVAPSYGPVHPTGKPWAIVEGSPATIPVLTAAERNALHAVIRSLDQMPPDPARFRQPGSGGQLDSDLRPGDDYNARADWTDVLTPHGWTIVCTRGDVTYWCRPGKTAGISATTGRAPHDNLYVFSTSTPFDNEKPYSKFWAYALLEHGGDDHAAASELRRQGYGTGRPASAGARPAHHRAKDEASDPAAEDLPQIETGSGPVTIRALREAIDTGTVPETYVSGGQVVHLERVSGAATGSSGDQDSPLPITPSKVGPPELAALLATHTYTYRIKKVNTKGDDGSADITEYEEEVTPPTGILAAALAPKEWPNLRPLIGIAGAPVLRPDGSLLQTPGYDKETGLYLASKVPLSLVPEAPSSAQVNAARDFMLQQFLGDFPWVGPADKANYIGLLVTPILRSYLRTLIPFGVVTSTMPGSGKTILTCGLGMLYGQRVLTWTASDEELRKAITSVLADPVGTIIFDNLAEGTTIDSPVLARLITDRTWADRLLGKNTTAAFQNDRVWTATGNNLRLGGDMRTRSILVSLNPDMPRPEERTGFAIPNLDQWILSPANQRRVLWHLLILVADWTRNGAPGQPGITMRQFTSWAEAVGGFLAHHGIGGFLANVETVRDIDEDEAMWTAFFAQWRKKFGDGPVTSNQLRESAKVSWDSFGSREDPWDGQFITDDHGRVPSAKSLGRILTGQIGRYRGPYRLHSHVDPHSKIRQYRVEEWSG